MNGWINENIKYVSKHTRTWSAHQPVKWMTGTPQSLRESTGRRKHQATPPPHPHWAVAQQTRLCEKAKRLCTSHAHGENKQLSGRTALREQTPSTQLSLLIDNLDMRGSAVTPFRRAFYTCVLRNSEKARLWLRPPSPDAYKHIPVPRDSEKGQK